MGREGQGSLGTAAKAQLVLTVREGYPCVCRGPVGDINFPGGQTKSILSPDGSKVTRCGD